MELLKGLLKSILKNCWNFFILILTIVFIRNCVSFCIFVLSFATKLKQSCMLAPPPKIPPSQALPDLPEVTSHTKHTSLVSRRYSAKVRATVDGPGHSPSSTSLCHAWLLRVWTIGTMQGWAEVTTSEQYRADAEVATSQRPNVPKVT